MRERRKGENDKEQRERWGEEDKKGRGYRGQKERERIDIYT